MAVYKFACKKCDSVEIKNFSIVKFKALKEQEPEIMFWCKKCDGLSEFIRIFDVSSSKIKRDKEEMMREITEDSRKIVQSIKDGNANIIRNIYGEE
jgi:hypothetical protein